MRPINETTFELQATPMRRAPRHEGRIPARLAGLFRPRFDPGNLSPRLRRDAGLSERGRDRRAAARAPLIR